MRPSTRLASNDRFPRLERSFVIAVLADRSGPGADFGKLMSLIREAIAGKA
jgi:hypothetical protein